MLIVEDEPDIASCLADFFEARGFKVRLACSGEDALEWLRDSAPDAMLLDIRLPGVSGLEVLKQAKAEHPDVRVMMVTALDREEYRTEARHYGACGYVTKPFDFSPATWEPILANPMAGWSPA
jgi:DNA-binding response OmpR family regulator